MRYQVGDRVSLKKSALSLSYVVCRGFYTNMYEGKTGTVIGFAESTGKLAIEFDDIVFIGGQRSSHDNGCHGKGKLHYCWYIPEECVDPANADLKLQPEALLL
jgi:hypothetical protein